MSQNNGGDNAGILITVFFVAVICIIVLLSKMLGIDFNTSAKLLMYLALMTGVTGVCVYGSLSDSDLWSIVALGNTWPLLLAGYWVCFWPVLEYKASMDATAFIEGGIWWNAWYTKWGVLFTSVFGGYALKWLQKR